MAIETAPSLAERCGGIFLMPSFHRYDLVAEVTEAIRAGQARG